MKSAVLALFCLLFLGHGARAEKLLFYQVIKQATHNSTAFTQGLALDGDWLIESSGLRGKSFVNIYHANSAAPKAKWNLPREHFAEGLALFDKKIYLLTWTSGVLHILDSNTLKPLETKLFQGEGWGLAHDGTQFIMSNGSDELIFRDSSSFAATKKIRVASDRQRYKFLNELEYANGSIWANVWQSEKILRIDPKSGKVTGVLDLQEFVTRNNKLPGHSVLNGIAYDREKDAFWITGKLWPKRYLIKIAETQTEQER